jgi:flagellar basal body-associated protein FliL
VARKNEGIIALLMVLALIAFVIGSAIGITVSIGEHENQTNENNTTTHVENVTVEMTSNITNDSVYFDYVQDSLDFNDNYTREMYNLTN